MRFWIVSCLVFLCLAHSSGRETVRKRGINMVILSSTERERDYDLYGAFVGSGIIQDSCRGEVKFSSKLNHIDSSLDWIQYEVTPIDGETKVFEGWWYWKATSSFMRDYRAEHGIDITNRLEDMDLGPTGDEDGWQEECEYRSTDVSQCDRMFGHNMYYPERIDPNNGILTGKGDPQNPIY